MNSDRRPSNIAFRPRRTWAIIFSLLTLPWQPVFAHPLQNKISGIDLSDDQMSEEVPATCTRLNPDVVVLGFSDDSKAALLFNLPAQSENARWVLHIIDMKLNQVIQKLELSPSALKKQGLNTIERWRIMDLKGDGGRFPYTAPDDQYTMSLDKRSGTLLDLRLHSKNRGSKVIGTLQLDATNGLPEDVRIVGWALSPLSDNPFAVVIAVPGRRNGNCPGELRFRLYGTHLTDGFQ